MAPKPDDRSNNAERIREAIQNTQDNLRESEDYLDEHAEEIAPSELNALKQKNHGRQAAIAGFESELEDEEPFES
ncbi:small acid-soluble spore protein (thioredoxin-like protein) [Paenibacillus cellulosilyticus]|uniref:Small acid-soluble spore protein (Thioredoxin-like protein) n=1 Tax=Paenibacillus cellulosilyticus TaxID=375489 RepID=A0A2V2YRP3_9BACL|nr:small acid-soluble spore protein Tlp [Paenibacillus cellulosilyticus]PWW00682.1 small acid-soluble spore protein (thioredoxin-like protein) [Paenibacillus cellulosilyticus]QKS45543.1 small acid-soluble spore protein Tlp [Paenibacillus cellulosilyticus]